MSPINEKELLTIATIDDGTQETEVIISDKLKENLLLDGFNDNFVNVSGIMTLAFPNIGKPVLEEVCPVQACHVRSLLEQVQSHFGGL